MSAALGPLPGVALAGSAAAFPPDLDPARASLDGAAARRALGGADARADEPDRAAHAWGVERRAWWRAPGAPAPAAEDALGASGVERLAERAARDALAAAALPASALDLVVCATSTPSRATSALAAWVGRALGADAPCTDVRAGGAGGLRAWLAAALALAHGARAALVVAAETPSAWIDPADGASALLHGDGAAALVLRRDGGASGLLGARGGTLASDGVAFTVAAPLPPRPGLAYAFQRPDARYLGDLERAWDLATDALLALGRPDRLVPYPVTRAQLERVAARAGLPAQAAARTLAAHGCLGCAGPLVALHELLRDERPAPGTTLGLCAAAGGIAWQSLLWRL